MGAVTLNFEEQSEDSKRMAAELDALIAAELDNARLGKRLRRSAPAPAPPQQPIFFTDMGKSTSQKSQFSSWDEKIAASVKEGDVESFIKTLEKASTQHGLELSSVPEKKDSKGNTYLHVAAWFGRYQLIGLLTTDYGSPEWLQQENDEGDTAFHMAARAGHLAVIDLLLRCAAKNLSTDPKQLQNAKGNTILHEALLHNHHHLVELLLHSSPYSSCHLNNQGKSPFYLSVEAGNQKTFAAMLKAITWTSTHSDGLLDQSLMKGRSPLHAAVFYQDKVMLQAILAEGMHMLVHVKDEKGESLIELASRIGFEEGGDILRSELSKDSTDCCVVVVDVGFGANQVLGHNPHVEGVIQASAWDGRHERMRKLLLLGNVMLPQQGTSHSFMDLRLYEAARKGDVDQFITVVEHYFDERNIDLPTIFTQLTSLENTFLHVASRYGHKDLLLLIIWYFPGLLDRLNCHGNTAFHLAAREGHLDIVNIFVTFRNERLRKELTININSEISGATLMQYIVENYDGRTPLQLAHKHRQSKVVELLIKENVEEAYHVNKKGSSLLYAAILNDEMQLVKDIFNTAPHFVNQNVLDDQLMKGKSLLLAAVWSQKIEMLKELATQKPVVFKVQDEHAQQLVDFSAFLGFHQGANYLLREFEAKLVRDSTGFVIPHPYSLDAYSLSVIKMANQKIKDITQFMHHRTSRHERMESLLCDNSFLEDRHKQSMEGELYEAAKRGDIRSFVDALEYILIKNKSSLQIISEQKTCIGNTVLHVAAINGNEDITSLIAFYFRNLLSISNIRNNTPNHEAAKAGHLGVVDILVTFKNYHDQLCSSKEYDTHVLASKSKMHVLNDESNTSLHEAFVHNQRHVIDYLIKSNVEEAYHVNNEGKSGLYLAVEGGLEDVVKTMLSNMTSDVYEKYIPEFTSGKSLLVAAIQRKSLVMMREILRKIPVQIHVVDEDGQTPLICAVSIGFLKGVNCLVDEFGMDTSQMDSSGFYPVHVASKSGTVKILEKLLQKCPDAGGFINRKGQNILHVAAMYGRDKVVDFILQTPDLWFLINEIDEDGNTPLHLATINRHPKIVSCLTWDHRVKLKLVNKDGLTALDAAGKRMEAQTSFKQRLIWFALMSAGATRGRNKDRISSKEDNIPRKDKGYSMGYSKDRVNTLLLVSTLIVTVTFAAGLSMPGGNNDSEPKHGYPILLHKHMFQTFVICDTIALYSSVMVSVTLIWAQLGDLTLVVNALRLALPLLGLSLTAMSIAFMAGVSLLVSKLTWLADLVVISGIISLTTVLILFIPLCFINPSTSPLFRYITYYPFQLLVMASGGSNHPHIKED